MAYSRSAVCAASVGVAPSSCKKNLLGPLARVLLAAVLAFSLIPTSAFADSANPQKIIATAADLPATIEAGESYALASDITLGTD